MNPGKNMYISLVQLLGAFLFLSVVLNFDYPADHWFSWKLVQPSIDCWLLLIVLAIAACRSKRFLFWTTLSIYALFLVLRMIRIGDTVVPMYLNRPLNLYIDSGYIFSLYDLLKTSTHQDDVLLISASALVIVLVYLASNWYAWRLAAGSLSVKPVRISVLVISGLFLSAAIISGWRPAETPAIVRLVRGSPLHPAPAQKAASRCRPHGGNRSGEGSRTRLPRRSKRCKCSFNYGRVVWSYRLQQASI